MSDFSLDSHFRSTRRSAHPKSVYPATAGPREPFESGSISSAEWLEEQRSKGLKSASRCNGYISARERTVACETEESER